MSHDQRPGRLRVVRDAADDQRSGAHAVTIDGSAQLVASVAADASAGAIAPAKQGLPLLGILIYLLACVAGGVALALLNHAGLV